MQQVQKKKKRSLRHSRRWLLIALALLLAALGAAHAIISRPAEKPEIESVSTYGELIVREESGVAGIRMTLRSGETWFALRNEDGTLTVDDSFAAAEPMAQALVAAARIVSYEDVFTDDPAQYHGRLAEFGLDVPRAVAEITYTDGSAYTLRIGDPCEAEEGRVYYMTVDGDDRLFALDRGTAESLIVKRAQLYPVTQPVLHKARFDRITFADASGEVQAAWELQGGVGGNAVDRWLVTSPVRYPADGEAMDNLLANLSNIRLGAYEGSATLENLARCGFDAPRFTLTIHQAAGTIGTTDAEGRYGTTDWPESEFTLAVGGAKNDSVDYVLVDGDIYITSHYSLQVFMDMDALSTVSRYPVPVPLGSLAKLTVTRPGAVDEYVLSREEAPDGGETMVTCTLNGAETPYAAFEASYNRLLTATVTGRLPADWTPAEPPHTVYTFEDVTGDVHEVRLSRFDALHDAVEADGCVLFYIIRGGLELNGG